MDVLLFLIYNFLYKYKYMDKLLKYISKLENATNQDKIELYQTKISYYYNQVGGAGTNLISMIGFDRLTTHFSKDMLLSIIVERMFNPEQIEKPYDTLFKKLYFADDIKPEGKNIQLQNLEDILNNIKGCNYNSCYGIFNHILQHMHILFRYYGNTIEGRQGKRINKVKDIIFAILPRKIIINDKANEKGLSDIDIDFLMDISYTQPLSPLGETFKDFLKKYLKRYLKEEKDIQDYEIRSKLSQYRTYQPRVPVFDPFPLPRSLGRSRSVTSVTA